jgi:hypothetical protein
MKILFLDFDGVLNSHKWIGANQHLFNSKQLFMHSDVDSEAVARLQRIVDATGAKVVISSTWRRFSTRVALQAILRKHGFTGEVLGLTPVLNTKRGHEIQQWLDENGPIESLVILDDDSDMVHLLDKLVQTTFDLGLQDEHVEKAVTLLMGAS